VRKSRTPVEWANRHYARMLGRLEDAGVSVSDIVKGEIQKALHHTAADVAETEKDKLGKAPHKQEESRKDGAGIHKAV
ncbi:MAG: hypothetical protein KAU20_07700, partial [Nanoarchaeota archaeon]|nr:hypothetical protein [Nanoarchaeota archaeon]